VDKGWIQNVHAATQERCGFVRTAGYKTPNLDSYIPEKENNGGEAYVTPIKRAKYISTERIPAFESAGIFLFPMFLRVF